MLYAGALECGPAARVERAPRAHQPLSHEHTLTHTRQHTHAAFSNNFIWLIIRIRITYAFYGHPSVLGSSLFMLMHICNDVRARIHK